MRTWHSSGPRNLKDAFNDIYSFYPAKTPPLHDIDVIEETHYRAGMRLWNYGR